MHEDNFILNAARLNLLEKNIAVLKKIPKQNIDWPLFEKKAFAHGVDTFIYYSLKNHNLSELIPPETYKKFQEHYYQVAYQNSVFLDEVNKLSAIIDDKIVLLKGMDLIQTLYPNIAIRSMVDIDILVDSEKDRDIWNKLKIHGFEEHDTEKDKDSWDKGITNGFAKSGLEVAKSSLHSTRLSNARYRHLPDLFNGRCHLQVHWNIFERPQFSVKTKMAWEKAIPINSDKKIFRLSNEFLLLHLCSHLYSHKHQFILLRMLCDINELILKQGSIIDWNEINEICTDSELKNIITTALTYAHILLNTPVPTDFVNEKLIIKKTNILDSLAKGNKRSSQFSNYLIILNSISKPADRIKYVFRTIIPVREWMNENYHTRSGIKLVMAYLKYWLFQLNTNIIKRGIRNVN